MRILFQSITWIHFIQGTEVMSTVGIPGFPFFSLKLEKILLISTPESATLWLFKYLGTVTHGFKVDQTNYS